MSKNNLQEKQSVLDSIYNSLKIIFPDIVLLLVLFPMFIGLFINYDQIDLWQFIILLVWIPLHTLPFLFFEKKIFYYTVIILCFINGFVNLGIIDKISEAGY